METSTSYNVFVTDVMMVHNYSTGNETLLEPGNMNALAITRFVVQRVLVPIITSIGLIGNIISICVLTNRAMISSTNCYLTALAIFDLLYVIFSFTLSFNHYELVKKQEMYTYWYYYSKTLADICSNVSVCLTVTFSLERLVAVCYPMKGRAICTPQRARLITGCVVVFAVLCTAPEFFEMRLIEVTRDNVTKYEFVDTEMYQTDVYQIGYYNFIVFTFTFLPIILLSTFNGLLVRAVTSAMHIRKKMAYTTNTQDRNRRQKEQNRITVMLIGVVIVFLLCQFPNAALILYKIYLEYVPTNLTIEAMNNIRIAGNIVNLLILINSSTNFILYSAMSTKFRRVCLSIFCSCGSGKREPFTKTETSVDNGHLPLYFRSRKFSNKTETGGIASVYASQNRRIVRFSEKEPIPCRNVIHSKNTAPFVRWDKCNGNHVTSDELQEEDDECTALSIRKPSTKMRQGGSVSIGQRIICSTGGQRATTELDNIHGNGTTELLEIQFFLQKDTMLIKTGNVEDTLF
ncbi:hypothetical protein ACF0H5_023006 [Mactra antiquata]